ncbi:MAG TPA: LysR family transcriptional regulator [Sphingomicrobium sp.]|nr:LysR family transcriptional regulator [Sphingomicrobium sp.]
MDRYVAMRTFVRAVESGSFSAAARHLRVGQPTVSKIIARLESEIGVRLLMRSTRRLAPTEAGLAFYERARRAIEEAQEAEAAARGAGAGLSGRLCVSAGVTFARIHVLPRIQRFLGAHPQLTLDFVLDDRRTDLLADGIDVALRLGDLADSSLSARKLSSCARRVFGSAAYFSKAGEPRTPADLAAHEAIVYDQEDHENWAFRNGPTEVSVQLSGRIRVSAAEGVRSGVLAGLGIAVASEWMFGPELRTQEVRAVLTDWNLPRVDLWAVYPSGRMPTAKARAFAAFVETELKS